MNQKTNLNLLYTLEVLLAEKHVSRAADRLNLTQSAVSRQLSQLRDIYHDPLLVRSGNHYVLTPRAERLGAELEGLFQNITKVLGQADFDPQLFDQTFTFSSSDYVAQYILPELVEHLSSLAPAMEFAYRLWEPDNLAKLSEIDVQLASTMLPEAPLGLSSQQIGEDIPVIVTRKNHPLSGTKTITEQELGEYPHIRISGGGDKDSFLDREMKARSLKRRILVSTPFFSSAFALLQQTDALLTVPLHIAVNLKKTQRLHVIDIPFNVPTHKYWLLWHPKYDHEPAHRWTRDHVLSIMRSSMYSVR
ncbi:LysR family transcriptional regulator [Vibrio barjaei]|jgi:DNA-binding transcriptional LysR family regulator|uniref:LysR family transcriptional regulator n=1 Tax=Vibrio barjaei TaxID=1676683 RepID=A0ABW7IPW5_9VIBR|nr:LysR family transcriptional regulator [Vibrio barjaei]MCY9873415.1 LysR family transcriptional regulator [Vibrio barjaei]